MIETDRLLLTQWQEDDRGHFHAMNSDKDIMTFFPYRKTREQSDALFTTNAENLAASGLGFRALRLRSSGTFIGMIGLLRTDLEPFIPKDTVEIGWRILPTYQNNGFASEAAAALLDFGFKTMRLKKIVAFAVETNEPSIKVMQKIGMTARPDQSFLHPRVPDTHRQLQPHVIYEIKSLDGINPSER